MIVLLGKWAFALTSSYNKYLKYANPFPRKPYSPTNRQRSLAHGGHPHQALVIELRLLTPAIIRCEYNSQLWHSLPNSWCHTTFCADSVIQRLSFWTTTFTTFAFHILYNFSAQIQYNDTMLVLLNYNLSFAFAFNAQQLHSLPDLRTSERPALQRFCIRSMR